MQQDNIFLRLYVSLSLRVTRYLDDRKDKRICGMSLGSFAPSPYEDMGATGSQSIPYLAIDALFKDVEVTPEDHVIDVGCGRGRALAYIASKKYGCRITGVELNPHVASYASMWARNFKNIQILNKNAFDIDYNVYTIIYMNRPLETHAFRAFVEKLEKELTHPVMLLYYSDEQSAYILNDRAGWKLLTRKDMFIRRGLAIHAEPQRFSRWIFWPQ